MFRNQGYSTLNLMTNICSEWYSLDLIQHGVMILWPLRSEQALPKTTDQCDFITGHRIKPPSGVNKSMVIQADFLSSSLRLNLGHWSSILISLSFFPITWSTCLWPYVISINVGFFIRGVTLRSRTGRVRCCNNKEYKPSCNSTTDTFWWRVQCAGLAPGVRTSSVPV